ncbi:hypothetical protein [Thiohalophilus sp.]|uniref:hypothetical protein n=1 Tax=Thiohalophilus sp. TaxID=3028392 RepID=UPI002ACD699E|nr:hypothetical protein [Thiohalophilus sp.]MDZ7663313.1 hypothetical protein [Thiohalophilus sp.]
MTSGQLQLSVFSILVGAVTIGTLIFAFTATPNYLNQSRHGVPHLMPQVKHPQTGEPLEIDMLIRHYKGELDNQSSIYY